MDSGVSTGAHREDDGLRERRVAFTTRPALHPADDGKVNMGAGGNEDTKKTYGRTPDGTGTVMNIPSCLAGY